MKNTYYFPHDYHARHDPKIKAMMNDFGVEGYGMYWCLIEILYEQRDKKLEKFPKLFSGLSAELAVSPERAEKFVMSLVFDYRLLQENETHIWSNAVLRRIEVIEDKRLLKVKAGHIGGVMSGIVRRKEAKRSIASSNEANKRKRKEKKGKESICIYEYYSKTIKPGSREDAIKNIDKVLKAGVTKEDLIGRINAYKQNLVKNPTEERYYIQANNFFGEKARYKDFEPVKIVKYTPADPECKSCGGSGNLQTGEGNVIKCFCRKEIK